MQKIIQDFETKLSKYSANHHFDSLEILINETLSKIRIFKSFSSNIILKTYLEEIKEKSIKLLQIINSNEDQVEVEVEVEDYEDDDHGLQFDNSINSNSIIKTEEITTNSIKKSHNRNDKNDCIEHKYEPKLEILQENSIEFDYDENNYKKNNSDYHHSIIVNSTKHDRNSKVRSRNYNNNSKDSNVKSKNSNIHSKEISINILKMEDIESTFESNNSDGKVSKINLKTKYLGDNLPDISSNSKATKLFSNESSPLTILNVGSQRNSETSRNNSNHSFNDDQKINLLSKLNLTNKRQSANFGYLDDTIHDITQQDSLFGPDQSKTLSNNESKELQPPILENTKLSEIGDNKDLEIPSQIYQTSYCENAAIKSGLSNSENNMRISVLSHSQSEVSRSRSLLSIGGSSLLYYTKEFSDSFERDRNTVKVNKKFQFKSQYIDEILGNEPEKLDELKEQLNTNLIGAIAISDNSTIIYMNQYISEKLLCDRKKLLDHDIYSCVPPTEYLLLRVNLEDMNEWKTMESSSVFPINFYDTNHNHVALEAYFTHSQIGNINVKIMWLSPPQEDIWYVLSPKSYMYMTWISFIAVVLVILMIFMPYDMVFNDSKTIDALENYLTTIFVCDILINFNLAYEEDDMMINDRFMIIKRYLGDWFFIDLISTIPAKLLYEQLINTQIFKSLKIIRIFRFLKLVRLLRLTKIYHLLRLLNESTFKKVYNFLKQNQGYLDLLKNMLYIYLFAHFYAILFYIAETELICPRFEQCYKETYLPTLNPAITHYQRLLWEHILVALGLGAMSVYNEYEIYIMLLWMFIGLSLFGYGIGNISSYLNFANKQDLEYMETMNYFNELCIMNSIDPRLQTAVISNLEQNFSKYMDRELQSYSDNLSSHVFEQLELSLLEKFVHSFKIFEKVSVKSLRLIKYHMLIDSQKVIARKGTQLKNIYFLIEGTINIYNSKMKLSNYYEGGEIYGLSEFLSYFKHKYKIEIESFLQDHIKSQEQRINKNVASKIADKININLNKLKSMQGQENKMTKMLSPEITKKNTKDKPYKQKTKHKRENKVPLAKKIVQYFTENKIEFKQTLTINDDYLIYNYNAICSDKVKYLTIPFSIFEEIFFSDIDSFLHLYSYFLNFNKEITDEEMLNSDIVVNEFKEHETPALMLTNTGEVYDMNPSFISYYCLNAEVVGEQVFELIGKDMKDLVYSKLADYQEGEVYKLKVAHVDVKVTQEMSGPQRIVKYRQSRSLNLHKYSKSLISVRIMYLYRSFELNEL